MPKPIIVSHQGRLVELWPDGSRTDAETHKPIKDVPEPKRSPALKRWHDPYP